MSFLLQLTQRFERLLGLGGLLGEQLLPDGRWANKVVDIGKVLRLEERALARRQGSEDVGDGFGRRRRAGVAEQLGL